MPAPTVEDVARGDGIAINNLVERLKIFDVDVPHTEVSSADLSPALTRLQQSARLPVTAIYDKATADLIGQPSCDVQRKYSLHSHTWDHRDLTYCFDRYSDQLSVVQIRKVIADSFGQWAAYSPLTFSEVAPHLKADIRIRWASGDHGDGHAFDGRGNFLGHAFYPPPPMPQETLAGEIHFDEDENWTAPMLFEVASHEIGHALGLQHSSVPEALMWGTWTGRDRLHADDIEAIQAKYGVREGRWHQICASPSAVQIVATTQGDLYKRDSDGSIWRHVRFLLWVLVDNNGDTAQIDASSYHLDQRHYNGQVWRYTLDGWKKIDVGDGNVQIASARDGHELYQRHKNGQVWRYTGGSSWEWLDEVASTVEIATNHHQVFLRHDDGEIFLYTESPGDWHRICGRSSTIRIVGEGKTLYRLCSNGYIYRLNEDLEWDLLDRNPNNVEIVADSGNLYLRHNNGDVFWYTGKEMSWLKMSSSLSSLKAIQLAAGGERLFCISDRGEVWQILDGYDD